jgi:hypothetical protein
MLLGQGHDGRHVGRLAEEVHRNDGLGLGVILRFTSAGSML